MSERQPGNTLVTQQLSRITITGDTTGRVTLESTPWDVRSLHDLIYPIGLSQDSRTMIRPVRKILLVEPEAVLAELTAFRMELLGYHVDQVPSAEEALERIKNTNPDLIIIGR